MRDVERMLAYKPDTFGVRELESIESNGWCRPHIKTNAPACMTKGSVTVRDSQSSAVMQVKRFVGAQAHIDLEDWLSSRQAKDRRCVVFRGPKGCEATGHTHLGKFEQRCSPTLNG